MLSTTAHFLRCLSLKSGRNLLFDGPAVHRQEQACVLLLAKVDRLHKGHLYLRKLRFEFYKKSFRGSQIRCLASLPIRKSGHLESGQQKTVLVSGHKEWKISKDGRHVYGTKINHDLAQSVTKPFTFHQYH
jgi:hypothetical protein